MSLVTGAYYFPQDVGVVSVNDIEGGRPIGAPWFFWEEVGRAMRAGLPVATCAQGHAHICLGGPVEIVLPQSLVKEAMDDLEQTLILMDEAREGGAHLHYWKWAKAHELEGEVPAPMRELLAGPELPAQPPWVTYGPPWFYWV